LSHLFETKGGARTRSDLPNPMSQDNSKPWPNHPLLEVESEEIEIQGEDVLNVEARSHACVIGKLVADHYVSKETIRTQMVKWWKLEKDITFKVLGENLFLIEFMDAQDKPRVLAGRPWVFEGALFLVEDFDGRLTPEKIPFDRASFWVRMSNLPLVCMGREVGRKIGSTVGIVEEIDTDADGVGWGEYLRVRISIDLSKPLSRGRMLKLQGESTWVVFQYERLPRYCFQCGVIRHGRGGCAK
jgi:hypothetical protein